AIGSRNVAGSLIRLNFVPKNGPDMNGNGKGGNMPWILVFVLCGSLKNLYSKGTGGQRPVESLSSGKFLEVVGSLNMSKYSQRLPTRLTRRGGTPSQNAVKFIAILPTIPLSMFFALERCGHWVPKLTHR